jgi:hypothetical protein
MARKREPIELFGVDVRVGEQARSLAGAADGAGARDQRDRLHRKLPEVFRFLVWRP